MARIAGSNGEITNALIREKALNLFATHGYEAASMRMLGNAVGVKVAAIYHYYPTKQALLFDLLTTQMNALLVALDETIDASGEAPQKLDDFVKFHIGYHIRRHEEVFISYMELRSLEGENYTVIAELRRRYEAVLKSILNDGAAHRHFDIEDTHVTCMAILAMLTGVNIWYRADGQLTVRDVEAHYVQLTRNLVKA